MRILVDTHIFLWSMLTPDKLQRTIIDLLADAENEKFLSAASAWEIAIKYGKGSLTLPDQPKTCIPVGIAAAGILQLPIKFQDALSVADLPMIHRDPFDRLLIAQANNNGLQIVTDDKIFKKYDVSIFAA